MTFERQHERTIALLEAGGIPIRVIDPKTVDFWIKRGMEPEMIAQEIYAVQPDAKGRG